MNLQQTVYFLSPDLARVLRRFPLAILFAAIATAVALTVTNTLVRISEEDALRLFAGATTGFVLALAGRLFAESRPEMKWAGIVLSFLLPPAAALLFAVRSTEWLALPVVPAAAVMWLSVSAFTRIGTGDERREIENRFWWLNQRAVISGGIAIAASAVLLIGLLAVDRSLDLLFGISIWHFLVDWVLPVVFCFLAPVYWLSVLPRLDDFDATTLVKPDFLTGAIGFVGLIILTPLLFVYSLILVAYAVQIALTQTLPVGVLGWLVLAFVVTGAANWLILHPAFIRDRWLSRFYLRAWFWATVLPLVLFALGLSVRITAYGLTPERMLLIAGGVWAVVLTLFYLLPGQRGDIRLVPGLAGLAFVLLSFGPFNLLNAPVADQAHRFETALTAARQEGGAGWTPELSAQANGAADYLKWDEAGAARLRDSLARHGFSIKEDAIASTDIATLIGQPPVARDEPLSETLTRTVFRVDPVADVPFLLGEVSVYPGDKPGAQASLELWLDQTILIAAETGTGGLRSETDLTSWLAGQGSGATISEPAIDFILGERRYRLIARVMQVDHQKQNAPAGISFLTGWLFSDRAE